MKKNSNASPALKKGTIPEAGLSKKNNWINWNQTTKRISVVMVISCLALSCKKGTSESQDVLSQYTAIPSQTLTELKMARNATARYQNLDSALADGYVDIDVNTQNMGHHFMKESLVDGIVDLEKPEILVYNKDHHGKPYLVAIEYAVPLNLPKPEGYTGDADVWDGNVVFQLWLLHAWVWNYNPAGVFHSTNPSLQLH